MTISQMYKEIVDLERKLRNNTQRYGISDPAKRAELEARLDYLKNAHREAVFEIRNAEIEKDKLSKKLDTDNELGYGKASDIPEKKELRFTPAKPLSEAQQEYRDKLSRQINYRMAEKERAIKAAKELGRVNAIDKVKRKYQLPFYLKKVLGAIDGPLAAKIGAGLASGGASLALEAATEGIGSTESGSTPNKPEYWEERGVRDSEEQIQRARRSSFGKDLPSYSKIPSAYEKPELRKYKEDVLRAEKEGTLRDNYVEDMQEEDDYKKFKTLMDKLKQ